MPVTEAIRCYLPTTLGALAAAWETLPTTSVTVFAPADTGLRGEAREEAEWTAFEVAAAQAVDPALATGEPRVILALDAGVRPADRPLGVYPGVVTYALPGIESAWIVSAHMDEASTVDAVAGQDAQTAAQTLLSADLLWYDAAEIPLLIDSSSQGPAAACAGIE